MKRAFVLSAAILLSPASFAAPPASSGAKAPSPPAAKGGGFKIESFGEGGGYTHPDSPTDDYLEGGLRPDVTGAAPAAAPKPQAAPEPARAVAAPPPAAPPRAANETETAAAPSSPRPAPAKTDAPSRPTAARPAASGRNASVSAEARAPRRESLWNGLLQPLDMPASEVAGADPDAASAASGRDYETHILGLKAGSARATPALAPAAPAAGASAPAQDAATDPGRVFVSLELDPREAGTLRDAVAGLGAAAGFAADARFEPRPGPHGTALISGWLPAGRLSQALSQPGVKRVQIERGARPGPPDGSAAPFVIGLRLDDPAHPRAGVAAGVRALAAGAGFRLTRVVGLETAPDGRAVAVVEGRLPLSRLSAAMALPQVAKISPRSAAAVPEPAAPASTPSLAGFGRFAVQHGLWLIVLTLLLALPSLRSALGRVSGIFNPYR